MDNADGTSQPCPPLPQLLLCSQEPWSLDKDRLSREDRTGSSGQTHTVGHQCPGGIRVVPRAQMESARVSRTPASLTVSPLQNHQYRRQPETWGHLHRPQCQEGPPSQESAGTRGFSHAPRVHPAMVAVMTARSPCWGQNPPSPSSPGRPERLGSGAASTAVGSPRTATEEKVARPSPRSKASCPQHTGPPQPPPPHATGSRVCLQLKHWRPDAGRCERGPWVVKKGTRV